MNTIIRYNWNPWILSGAFVVNSSLSYYNDGIKGRVKYPIVGEWCTEKSHVYYPNAQICKKIYLGNLVLLPLIYLAAGGVGVSLSIYDTYENYKKHEQYISSDKKMTCFCGGSN